MYSIYTGNHYTISGVEDYIETLTLIFLKRGFKAEVSNKLNPKLINIIIDEFSNTTQNRILFDFRRNHPNAKLILVATEFIEYKNFIRSFNFFSNNLIDSAVVSLMNSYFRVNEKSFILPGPIDFLISVAYIPLLIYNYILFLIIKNPFKECGFSWRKHLKKFLKSHYNNIYFLRRYIGLESVINCMDGVILSHSMIANNLIHISGNTPIIGVFFPEIDIKDIKRNIFKGKELCVEVTGTVTPYRLNKIEEINHDIDNKKIGKYFQYCKSIPMSLKYKDVTRCSYSLHPPQTDDWKYASPTRIYRALCHDNNMPILTKYYGQHPIEDICFVYKKCNDLAKLTDFFLDKNRLYNVILPRINKYTEIATSNNNEIIRKIKYCLKNIPNK